MTAQAALDVVTALSWVVVVYKLPALRRNPGDVARRYYWLTLLLIALSLTVLLPNTYLMIDKLSGVPNLARLLGDALALTTSWAAQALLFHLIYPHSEATHRARTIGLILGMALLLMAVCFALAPLPDEALDFTGRYQHTPLVFEYRLVFLASLGMGMGNAARLFWRYGGLAGKPTLRFGLRLCSAAAALGLVYVANEVVRSATARLQILDPMPNPGLVSQVLLATFIAVGLVGATVSAWGPRLGLDRGARWLGHYRSLQRLYPLWLPLYQIKPDIALDPPPSRLADRLSWRRVSFRLYRRVVEIRDGWLLLRPAMDLRVLDYAQRLAKRAALSDPQARAVIDAAVLAVALHRPPKDEAPADDIVMWVQSEGANIPSEIAALERVADCYRHSPIVRAVVARFDAEQARHSPAASEQQ